MRRPGSTGVLVLCLLPHVHAVSNAGTQNYNLVDPFIGSLNGGNVFVGASLPFGMAKAVADVSGQNTAGWAYDFSNVTGFSALHDAGTGGEPSMGNFPLSVQPSCPGDQLENCQFGSKYDRAVNYKAGTPKAQPGYFSLGLTNNINVEMTVTSHTALYNFNLSKNGSSPLFLIDLTDLQDSRQNASVSVDPQTGRIKGNGTFLPSFGVGSYQSYFCADFKGASIRDTGVWVNGRAGTEPKQLFVNRGYSLFYIQAGGFVRLAKPPGGTVQARVGMSFFSTEQACANAESEIPDWDFTRVRGAATAAWKSRLGNISVVPGANVSRALQTTFFSGIYRTMLSPQNYTGENPLWRSAEPYYDSYYCTWDSFRSTFPYLLITQPDAMAEMIRSYLNIYQHLGWLPDCRMQLCKGYTQGGSNADVVLADAYLKNLTLSIDWALAYAAVVNDAENEPFDWGVEGRGGLSSWKALGYIPVDDFDPAGFGPAFHSVSRTLEYAYDDFAIALMARRLGHAADAAKYLSRASNWARLFKANQTAAFPNGTSTGGFVGYFQPRYANGTWRFQAPVECSPLDGFCSYSSNPRETFESSIWEYQFYVPQDVAGLIRTLGGGDANFVRRLDYLHESGIVDLGVGGFNEPAELLCFQYHYAGRPGRSSYRVHTYIPAFFNSSVDGLNGNDDSGATGSFIAFTMSGLFPVAGQNVYLLTPPFFESVSYTSPLTGKTATIRNVNFDAAYRNIYIQKATLDGKPYTRNWIGHEFFLNGGTLEFTLGNKESAWGTGKADRPPSLSDGSPAPYNAGLDVMGFVNDGQ